MLLEEKKKTSEVSEFLPYTQNRNLGKCSFTSNSDSCCNLKFRNAKMNCDKNVKVIKWIKKKKETSEVSEFSILPYTQNRKRGNLGKFSFTSNFDSSCNFFQICIF